VQAKNTQQALSMPLMQEATWYAAAWGVALPALLFAIVVTAVRPVMDPDCWFHMAYGRLALDTGTIPARDVFSHTAEGQAWISSGWLSSIIIYMVDKVFGLTGLPFLATAVEVLTYGLVFAAAALRYRAAICATLFLLAGVWEGYLRFTPRPEIFSHLFLALELLVFVRANDLLTETTNARVPRFLWIVPILLAVWSNFHAGVLLGVACAVLFFGLWMVVAWKALPARDRGMLAAMAAVSSIAWMANPYGWQIAGLASKIKSMPFMKDKIMEWMPIMAEPILPQASYLGLAVLLGLAVTAVVVRLGRSATTAFDWTPLAWRYVMVAAFAALPFWERRHQGLTAIAIPILLLPDMRLLEPFARRFIIIVGPILLLMAGSLAVMQKAGTLKVGKGLLNTRPDTELLPTVAGEFLKNNPPPPRLFNTYGPGGYLIYRLGPQTKVFIDGRLDVYTPDVWRDYLDTESGRLSTDELTKKYDINSAFLYIKGANGTGDSLAARLSRSPDWALCYFDDNYALFVRKTPETASFQDKHAYRFVSPFDLGKLNPGSVADMNRLEQEIKRALETSQGCARAHIIAAVHARNAGDEAAAEKQMEEARKKNPSVRTVASGR